MLKRKTPKNPKYLAWVRTQPCVITGQYGVEAHHLKSTGEGGMGIKASDYYAMPLIPEIHKELHDHGWRSWEEKYGSQWKYALKTLEQYVVENMN